jgi:hypothetical protein
MCGAFAAVTDVLFLEHLSFVFEFFSSPAARENFTFHPTASNCCGISPNECKANQRSQRAK